MHQLALKVPQPIEVVRAPEIAEILETQEAALLALGARATSLRQTARALEARLAVERVDPDTAAWMMLRLQRFLVTWREEVDAEVEALRRGAEQRAARIRRTGRGTVLSLTGALAARRSFPDLLPALPEAMIRWTPAEGAAPTVAPAPVAVAAAPVVEPVAPVAPVARVAEAAEVAEVAEAAEVAEVAPVPLSVAASAAMVDPLLAGFPAVDDHDDEGDASVAVADETKEFWPGDARRPGLRRRRVSAAVVLQVLAGAAALGAVAVRFG